MKILFKLAVLFGLALILLLIPEPALAHPGHGNHVLSFTQQILTPQLAITGLIVALLFGVVHGLTPGHGKTIATAYLVGSNSTLRHALMLSMVVTLTHTLGIIALGLIVLLADRYLLPEQLYYIFSLLSGITISVIGFWQLESYFNPPLHHHHHHHDGTSKSLVGIGIAGGLVPCSEALILLLGAVALHRTLYGLELVTAFSLGLGLTLTVVGAIAIYCRQWLERSSQFKGLKTYFPLISAAIVSIVGLILTTEAII